MRGGILLLLGDKRRAFTLDISKVNSELKFESQSPRSHIVMLIKRQGTETAAAAAAAATKGGWGMVL